MACNAKVLAPCNIFGYFWQILFKSPLLNTTWSADVES